MIPLYSVNQIRNADEKAINNYGIPGIVLMENASISIYNAIKNHLKQNDTIGIVCGKGNNGGDGFAVARHLSNHGYRVKVIYLAGEEELNGDAKSNFIILKKLADANNNITVEKYISVENLSSLHECRVIVDALLGTGTRGMLRSPYQEIITELNEISAYKAAIDIPSGLNADSGYGETVFNSDLTITLAELKKGLFIEKGYSNSGRIVKGDIGTPENYFNSLEKDDYLIELTDALKGLPTKKKDINKYSAGKVFVIAGSAKLPGAALMTSTAAMKVGAGAVILSFPESLNMLAHSKLNEVIVEPYDDKFYGMLTPEIVNNLSGRFNWMNTLAIGPGLGRNQKTIEAVLEILSINTGKKIVIDADALFAIGQGKYKEINLENCVLTPHHGEFSNLIGVNLNEIKQDVLQYGKDFVSETRCYLILKGAPTIIFLPSGKAYINSTGNSGMAKFGTGDVLTGILAGLLAQNENIETSIVSAVYIHSYAADLLINKKTELGIMASDILNAIPDTIKTMRDKIVNID